MTAVDYDLKSDANQQLDDAVQELVGNKMRHDADGSPIVDLSLYVEMTKGVNEGYRGYESSKVGFRSQAPVWIGGVSWLNEVEKCVKEWAAPERGNTLTLLDGLTRRRWTPEQTPHVLDMAKRIRKWSGRARGLLGKAWIKEIRVPCIECQAERFSRKDDLGDTVNGWAIVCTDEGIMCRACGVSYERERTQEVAEYMAASSGDTG